MPLVCFTGDLHGDLDAAQRVVEFAVDNKADEIVQLGDWGFVFKKYSTLDELSRLLTAARITMRFCDGNHDTFKWLFNLKPDADRLSQDHLNDNAAPYVIYQHRGSRHVYADGTAMVFLGGAASIDYRFRKENVSWWPEELITDADVDAALHWRGQRVDYLVTHDSPVRVPGFKESDDMTFYYRAQGNHERIAKVTETLAPKTLIHGHWHHRYSSQYLTTKIEGLDCNYGKFTSLVLLVDTAGTDV